MQEIVNAVTACEAYKVLPGWLCAESKKIG